MDEQVVPAGASIRVQHALHQSPNGRVRVVHRSRLAVYVDLGPGRSPRCVGVLASGAVTVPCGLRTALPDLGHLGEPARVEGGRLRLGDTTFAVGRLLDVRVPRIEPPAAIAEPIDPPVLIGRGAGLTPEGDDLVCGWLAAHRAAGVATPEVDDQVRSLLPRTTLLSATLIESALQGECLPQLASWLQARGSGREHAARAALLAVGASSGAALLAGAERALGLVAA